MEKRWISRLAEWAYQRPGEIAASESRSRLVLAYGAVAVLVCAMGAMGFVGFRREFALWKQGKPEFPFPKSEWRVLLTDDPVGPGRPDFCGIGRVTDARCPAHPKNSALWSSTLRRSDPEHRERLRLRQGKVFWVGALVPRKLLVEASAKNAKFFLIGKIGGTYRIYLDGQFWGDGANETSRSSAFVSFTNAHLAGADAWISIEIQHDQKHFVPDFFNADMGGEGLLSSQALDGHFRRTQFLRNTLQVSTALVQLTIALLFFFVWVSARWKRENLIVALYAFVNACIQLRQIDSVLRTLGPTLSYNTDIALRISEAIAGMAIGLSFSRTRKDLRHILIGTVAVFALVGWARVWSDTPTLLLYSQALGLWLIPSAFGISIVSMVVQAVYLQTSKGGSTFVPARAKRLIGLAVIQVSVLCLYIYQAQHIATDDQQVLFFRFSYLSLTILLGAVVLSEYREREKILRESPVSKWFLRGALPDSVPGILLKFDLKGSEQLESEYSTRGYGELTDVWYRYCSKIIGEKKGEVLSEEGDCILAYFDFEEEEPSRRAMQAIEEIHRMHAHLQPALGLKQPILFRGSMVEGRLQPIWKGEGRQKKAGYSGEVLKDAERILKLELAFDPGRTKSNLLIEESVALSLTDISKNIVVEEIRDSGGVLRRFYKIAMGPILLGSAPSKNFLKKVA